MTVPTNTATGWRATWVPTPKWSVATVAAVGTIATLLVEADGEWTKEIVIATIGLAVQRASAYIAPNNKES